MIELLAAAQIASIVGNAVSTLDKVYERFVTYKTKRPADEVVHPPSIVFGNEPGNEQFACRTVGNGGGAICQVVKYEELKNELKPEDLSYVSAIDRNLRTYEKQWNSIYIEIPLASGLSKAQLDSQLDLVSERMGEELARLLKFLEKSFGMRLDDHYIAIRDIVNQP
jgi:hypothetical protein